MNLFHRPPAREGAYAERRCPECGGGPVRWTYVPPRDAKPQGPGIHECEACQCIAYGWPHRARYPRQVRRVVRRVRRAA